MKRRKKALLLASALSLCVLCGCGEAQTVEIDGVTYVQNGDEYTRIDIVPRVFEPGEHVIYYTVNRGDSSFGGKDGWGTSKLNIPEVPEGYRYVETLSLDEGGYGYTDALVHIFVNEKKVEVKGTYNTRTNTVEYNEPGRVVEELTLGN